VLWRQGVNSEEEERDNPAREEGKFTHKKKQYPRKTLGVAVENVTRFCPAKIDDLFWAAI